MASNISLGEESFFVSNQRLLTLVEFALEVAASRAEGSGFVARLRTWFDEDWFNGCDFDLAEQFPTIDERKFWAACFYDVAHRIFLRRIGNQEVTFWQSSAIGDAYIIARILTHSVQKTELGWHPTTEEGSDAEPPQSGPLHIRQ